MRISESVLPKPTKSLELEDHWMRTLKNSKSENARLPPTNRPIQ